jgi:hypothetical protein
MPVAKEDDIRRIIGPDREARLWRAIHRAWDDVAADISRYNRWPRSRANMMFERLAVRLQEEFADEHPKVRFSFSDETVKIIFDEYVLARCKKANGRGFAQNVETQATLAFCEAQDDLPGFQGFQKIEIVYVVNDTGTAINGIIIQARDGDKRLWAYSIERPASADDAMIPPVPLSPRPHPPTSDGSDLVQPRKKLAEKEEDDKSGK